jgi:5-methylcytosine-specific restriction protein A
MISKHCAVPSRDGTRSLSSAPSGFAKRLRRTQSSQHHVDAKQVYEARRKQALPWRAWYHTPRWRALRAAQLRSHPTCEMCKTRGIDRPATVCNHINRHEGDLVAFWQGPFNSLCKQCHDSDQQRIEGGNQPRSFADSNGWPRDPRHPWFNR